MCSSVVATGPPYQRFPATRNPIATRTYATISTIPSRRLDLPFAIVTPASPTAPAIATSSSQRKLSGSSCVNRSERSMTAGTTRNATCALDETAISLASFIFPAQLATRDREVQRQQCDGDRDRHERGDVPLGGSRVS